MSKGTTRLRALGALVGIAAVAVTAIAVTGASAKPRRQPVSPEQGRHADRRHEPAVQAADVPERERPAGRLRRRPRSSALAKRMGVKLNIKNLDFNGLIPGLVSKKFDMVSVGLSDTPERRKAVTLQPAYVPYAQILAAQKSDTTAADDRRVEHLREDDHLAAGLDRRAAREEDVPERRVEVVPGPERGVPRGRNRPRRRHRGRELPARAVQQVERQQARSRSRSTKPLHVEYGS